MLVCVVLVAFAVVCQPGAATPREPKGPPSLEDARWLPPFDPQNSAAPGARAKRGDAPPVVDAVTPKLIDFGPRGETSVTSQVQFVFDAPVRALGEKEEVDPATIGLAIEPPLPGRLRWEGPDRLVFEPEGELPEATAWRVRAQGSVTSETGAVVPVQADFSFSTPRPSVQLYVPNSYRTSAQGLPIVHWKHPVWVHAEPGIRAEAIAEHLHANVTVGPGESVALPVRVRRPRRSEREDWSIASDEQVRVIEPVESWPLGSQVVIEVDGDLPTTGPLNMGDPARIAFSIEPGLVIQDIGCVGGEFGDGCGVGPITVQFSNPVSRSQLRHIRLATPVRGFEVRPEYEDPTPGTRGLTSAILWGEFKLGDTITLEIDGMRDVYGQPQPEPFSTAVSFVEPAIQLALSPESGTLTPDRPLHVGVDARHLETVVVSVASLDARAFVRLGEHPNLAKVAWPGNVIRKEIVLRHEGSFAWSSQAIDLRDFVGDAKGPVLLEVAAGRVAARAQGRAVPKAVRRVYQTSGLALTGMTSLPRSAVRVTRLPDQAPVQDARILRWSPAGAKEVARTDALGRADLGDMLDWPPDAVIEVVTAQDRLVVDARGHAIRPEQRSAPLRPQERVIASITTERGAYRPKETVRVTGWSAIATPFTHVGLRTTPAKTKVALELHDARGEVVATRRVATTKQGKFWASLPVPAHGSLGRYVVTASLLGEVARETIAVEDFRTPEFEVGATTTTPDIGHGDAMRIMTTASYYFGDAVPMTSIRAQAQCQPSNYRPPGLDPRWLIGWGRRSRDRTASGSATTTMREPGRGQVELEMVPTFTHDDRPFSCAIAVAVRDASAQEVGADTTVNVHPDFYLALTHLDPGHAPHDTAIVVRTLDHTGATVAVDDIVAKITRRYSTEKTRVEGGKRVFDGWVDRTDTLAPCRMATSAASPEARCDLSALPHGRYTIALSARQAGVSYTATVDDAFWVSRPYVQHAPRLGAAQLTLELSARDPAVGDRVEALVSAPFDGQGELVLAAGGVRTTFPFTLADGTAHVPLEVDEAWVPQAQLIAVVPQAASAQRLAQMHWKSIDVSVPATHRRLAVDVRVPAEARPREMLPIEVRVADDGGKPVVANVSLWAVDEAVLSLRPVAVPPLVDLFAPARPPGVERIDSHTELLFPFMTTKDPYVPIEWSGDGLLKLFGIRGVGRGGGGYGVGFGGGGGRLGQVRAGKSMVAQERSAFETAPIYIGDVLTDEHGIARVQGELPDNLTTFRVTAIASAGVLPDVAVGRFGVGEQRVRVSRPLVVRPVLPRLLRPGDVAELGLIVQNLGSPAGTVDVELEVLEEKKVLEILSPTALVLAVDRAGQARANVRVRALAVGTPQIRVLARHRGSDAQDATRIPLPIEREPTTLERVAAYGELGSDRPTALPLKLPEPGRIDLSHGGLSVSMTSTLLGGLEDAARYLVDYPHGCIEQTSSRLLPLVALGELARQYPLGIEDPKAFIEAGLARVQSMQVESGGFAYWPGDTEPSPYASAYATWVLVRAQRAGVDVPAPMLERALKYLSTQLSGWSALPAPSPNADIAMALSLQALAEAGTLRRGSVFDGLWERRGRLPIFAQGLLLMAMHTADAADARVPVLRDALLARVDERNDSARIETSGHLWWSYFDSDHRSSAIVLSALLHVAPDHRLVAKLARGLMQARQGGRWANTQENAYALLAMADYARLRERDVPDFDAAIWLGGQALVREAFEGRQMNERRAHVSMQALLGAGTPGRESAGSDPLAQVLLLEKRGPGRLYYRVGLDWAPTGEPEARAEGIGLVRALRRNEGKPSDEAPELGELLAIDLEVTTETALSFVAIEVPLPAGLEGVNAELGAGSHAMRISGRRAAWVSHQEVRADRVMVYADAIEPGRHGTTVFVRATTPGVFHWPATTAEMMYYPEVYGRTAASMLEVHR